MTCTSRARFGWGRPGLDPIVVDCENDVPGHNTHAGLWHHNYPNTPGVTTVIWIENDRRTFRGEWVECPHLGCILPAGHPRHHSDLDP